MTVCSEFNFFSDPEAAKIVLTQLQGPITVIGMDPCYENALTWVINAVTRFKYCRQCNNHSQVNYFDNQLFFFNYFVPDHFLKYMYKKYIKEQKNEIAQSMK